MNGVNRADIHQLLTEMRQVRNQMPVSDTNNAHVDLNGFQNALGQIQGRHAAADVAQPSPSIKGVEATNATELGDVFSNAINHVNGLQQNAASLAEAHTLGDQSVGIADVMVASEKAKVAFQATVQVRNKIVQAYQDIMNMPI